jgi:hypothetical protein
MYMPINMHILIHAYTHTYIHTYIRTCTNMDKMFKFYIYAYLHKYMHTYINTYMYVHGQNIQKFSVRGNTLVKLIAFELAGEDRDRMENPVLSRLKIAFSALHKRG